MRLLVVAELLLGSPVAQAQGAFSYVRSAQEYRSATVIVLDNQGKRTQRMFTAPQGLLASDSLLYQAYMAYTA